MKTENFLVEIGTEELPPKALQSLAQAFEQQLVNLLRDAKLSFSSSKFFATPRRLAVKIFDLATKQSDQIMHKRGPSIKAAFDEQGSPRITALSWAKSCGISLDDATIEHTDKGDYLAFDAKIAGKMTASLLIDLIGQALAKLPIPKTMRWGEGDVQFVRPVHSVTVLLGAQLIEGEIFKVRSSRTIRGHRFLGEQSLTLASADEYPHLLEQHGMVIADFDKRRQMILDQATNLAGSLGGVLDADQALLDEVTALIEYPCVMRASFDPRFLRVPSEALVYTMKGDQKYFPIYDENHHLLSHFIFVANINPDDPSKVIAGNEKVIRPRLCDAQFFFDTDVKQPLEHNLERLKTVLFHKDLGTLFDKTNRLIALSDYIGNKIGAQSEKTKRAATLAKCDLMSTMVFEFTETQGIMGMHYALAQGEDEVVAKALNEHYLPRFAGDDLPESKEAIALALSDKIDTLTAIFAINQAPKGDKDPFALRRNALGILRILIEKRLDLDLKDIISYSISLFADKIKNPHTLNEVLDFIFARFKNWYSERGVRPDVLLAVLSAGSLSPYDINLRVQAVNNFLKLTPASMLLAANKRVSHLLAKSNVSTDVIDLKLCMIAEERVLAERIIALENSLQTACAQHHYEDILTALVQLHEPINNFFEKVMVNCKDETIRLNRLAIVKSLHNLFLKVADISLIR